MTDNRTPDDRQERTSEARTAKKLYQKPAFRFEQVFETAALACGKVFGNVGGCGQSKKSS